MIRFMLVMVPVVFLINGFTKGDWLEALLFAVAVAVGLTPEMLPMIVTVNLAKGALAMSRKKVIVKRLNVDPEFRRHGRALHRQDRHAHPGPGHPGAASATSAARTTSACCEFAYLNSYYQTGLKNLLDVAVLEQSKSARTCICDAPIREDRRDPVRLLGGGMSVVVARSNGTARLDLQGRRRGNFRRLHARPSSAANW